MTLQDQLTQCLQSYATDGLYILGGIPSDKLTHAIQNFPIDARDTVLALIDGTIMGSCKRGMAFGLRGVYWRNDWTTKTQRNFMTWEELNGLAHLIGAKTFDVVIGPGNACNLSGANVKPQHAVNLLHQLIAVYNDFKKNDSGHTVLPVSQMPAVPDTAVMNLAPCLLAAPALASPDDDQYAQGMSKAFAVLICADGTLVEAQVDLAIAFLEADEGIREQVAAISALTSLIEELLNDHAKSRSLFKLKCSKLIAQVRHAIIGPQREHVLIMLEELFDQREDRTSSTSAELYDKLTGVLQ